MKLHNWPDVKYLFLVGDIHGDVRSFATVVDSAFALFRHQGLDVDVHSPEVRIIQLGDWGAGWENAQPKLLEFPVCVLDGNHEHFPLILSGTWESKNPNVTYLPRGTILRLAHDYTIGVCGGADSIDKLWRTEGLDWFHEEALTEKQVTEISDFWQGFTNKGVKIRTILGHDLFYSRYQEILNVAARGSRPHPTHFTSKNLQKLADKFQPDFWFHGHHHVRLSQIATLNEVPFSGESGSRCQVECLDTISNYTNLQRILGRCVVLVEIKSGSSIHIHNFVRS